MLPRSLLLSPVRCVVYSPGGRHDNNTSAWPNRSTHPVHHHAFTLHFPAGACWLPVVAIQIRMKAILDAEAVTGSLDEARLSRLFGWWFVPGWPAFGGLIAVFYLTVAKPSW
jgi:uncharacterized membrane protein